MIFNKIKISSDVKVYFLPLFIILVIIYVLLQKNIEKEYECDINEYGFLERTISNTSENELNYEKFIDSFSAKFDLVDIEKMENEVIDIINNKNEDLIDPGFNLYYKIVFVKKEDFIFNNDDIEIFSKVINNMAESIKIDGFHNVHGCDFTNMLLIPHFIIPTNYRKDIKVQIGIEDSNFKDITNINTLKNETYFLNIAITLTKHTKFNDVNEFIEYYDRWLLYFELLNTKKKKQKFI